MADTPKTSIAAPAPEASAADLIAEARALRTDSPRGDLLSVVRELANSLAALGDMVAREDYAPWVDPETGERSESKQSNSFVYEPRDVFPPDTRPMDERRTPSDPMEEMHREAVMRAVTAERERDDARLERDLVAKQAPHADSCRTGWEDGCTCYKRLAPTLALAQHDAELLEAAAAEITGRAYPNQKFKQWLNDRAASIREAAGRA
jgi:hypothetical protein